MNNLDLLDLPANLDQIALVDLGLVILHLVDKLDLADNLDRLPILGHEDFSLIHLLLQLDLSANLDLADNLDLVDLVDLVDKLDLAANLVNHKVLCLHQQQVMHLRVGFSHYL